MTSSLPESEHTFGKGERVDPLVALVGEAEDLLAAILEGEGEERTGDAEELRDCAGRIIRQAEKEEADATD